tara:strand:+ start:711 stop:1250 length:540 start_codon:yes stop_codon:yes gene_type:complete
MTQWDELAVVTSDGSNETLEVTGITQTYNDLHVIFEGFVVTSSSPNSNVVARLNQDSSSGNYATDIMANDANSALFQEIAPSAVDGWTVYRVPAQNTGTPTGWCYFSFDIINYTYAGARNCVAQNNFVQDASGHPATCCIGATGMTYLGTSAVTAVGIHAPSIAFGANSTLSIYGIKNS